MTLTRKRGGLLPAIPLLGALACGHAPPTPPPAVQQAEAARRARLPDDNRDVDGTWKDLDVKVSYAGGAAWAAVDVRKPRIRYFYRGDAKAKPKAPEAPADKSGDAAPEPVSSAAPEALRKLMPFDIESIAVYGGEATFVDLSKPTKPELWLSELEVSLENMASRAHLADGRPVLLEAHAKVQRTGDLAVFVSADPWSDALNFSGRAVLQGLATQELYAFLAEGAQIQVPRGTLNLYVAFTVKDGRLTGGVKPILKDADVRATSPGFFARTRAWLVDHVVNLFSDRVPGRNAVATVVKLEGTLDNPKTELLPAITGVLYNAYLRGLAAGFGGLPPADGSRVAKASTGGTQ